MSAAGFLVGAVPLAAALAALLTVHLTGFDQSADLPVELESRFYGFYLDRYPLFAFAIVYGVFRVLAGVSAPGPGRLWRRGLGLVLGLALVLGLSLHPTFGGFAMRAAFGAGGMAFLNQTPMPAAYLIGAAVAALLFGLAIGSGPVVAGGGWRVPTGFWRRLARGLGRLAGSFLVLWYALALVGLARPAGLGPWPHRPLDLGDTLLSAACLTLAFLPHALVVASRVERRPDGR